MKYKIISPSDFRHAIYDLGFNQSSLARIMQAYGDDRTEQTITRNIRSMLSGDVRISGEIKAILNLLAELRDAGLIPNDPKKQKPIDHRDINST